LKAAFVTPTLGRLPLEILGIRCRYHRRTHLGARHPARLRCIHRPRAPNATPWRGRRIAVEPTPRPPTFSPGSRRRSANTCTMRKGGDGSIGKPHGSRKWPDRTAAGSHVPEGLYIARTLVRDQREVLVRVLNATLHDQKHAKAFPILRCEPNVMQRHRRTRTTH
jgi:hypothetical protein